MAGLGLCALVFSSAVFLFLFLPIVLGVYFLVPKVLRNGWLLLASLIFYAWGEKGFVLLMLASIAMNYGFGLLVARFREHGANVIVAVSVTANLGLLFGFKYANLLVDSFNGLFTPWLFFPWHLDPVHLPIGISFFTFQAISYVVDVYRGTTAAQRNPVNIALYISLFPHQLAGPILGYHDMAKQIVERFVTLEEFAYGVRRFVVGLAKKVLIANSVAGTADQIFAIPAGDVSTSLAWLGIVCYTLQIYFDFSGYSDMAVGLGKMFGFTFVENFNYPYISRSIREFWRRWHMSLSTWFRDYVYFPLGGNRCAPVRNYFNLITVFFLCGLWHGASWSFVVWGLFHGVFLVLERLRVFRWLGTMWAPLQHVYALVVVMVGWVFFRVERLPDALLWLRAMAGFGGDPLKLEVPLFYLDAPGVIALCVGIIVAMPVFPALAAWCGKPGKCSLPVGILRCAAILLLFLLCAMQLAAGTYNPFIYFRF
jgi:alginate O-acetyltransferase complex protein AlgI